MSDEIENVEADEVKSKSGDPNAEAAKYRKQAKQFKDRIAELEGQLSNLQDSADRIAELENVIRTRTHKDSFAKLAQNVIKPEALEDAFTLSGWQVDSDDVDENKMGDVIKQLAGSKSYLRVESAVPGPEGNQDSPSTNRSFGQILPRPATGSGRGSKPSDKQPTNKRKPGRLA